MLTLSELDAQWARRLWSDVRVTTLRYAGGIGFTGVRRDEVEGRVGYLGTLNRSANTEGVRWLLDDVWPRVLERQPGAELQIAGVGASESLVRTIESVEGACFLGEVDDVERFYKSCQVFVAPVPIGGGVIVKVLDGLASGTALVTTTYGNEGIGGRDGRDLIVADSKEGFAAAVVRLLTDSSERSRMGASGLDFVRREFPDSKLVDQVEQFYRELLAVCQGRRGRSTGEP